MQVTRGVSAGGDSDTEDGRRANRRALRHSTDSQGRRRRPSDVTRQASTARARRTTSCSLVTAVTVCSRQR